MTLRHKALTQDQKLFLKGLFPKEVVFFEPEEQCIYGTDASRLFARPQAVVQAQNTEQIRELLAWAQKESVPIYPRARATNVVGACVPQAGGVVVSTLAMNKILEIDAKDFVAVLQPGVVSGDFQREVEKQNLFFPPDPASASMSTIGGNVSTNAGGMRAVKYGVTRDYVLGLEAVLPGGEIIRTGSRNHKDVVGLDLTGLLVGSEGTLGFISEIILKLLPLPQYTASLMVGFSSLSEALKGAEKVFQAGYLPVTIEFLDQAVLRALEKVSAVPWSEGTNSVLLFKVDGSKVNVDNDIAGLIDVLKHADPSFIKTGIGAEEENLWEIRRLINPASFQLAPDKLAQDITVPRGQVARVIEKIHEIGREIDLPVLTFGHLGDGNIHTNVMYSAKDKQEQQAAKKAMSLILDEVLARRGTISGEHGIGLLKLPYLDKQLGGRERQLMRELKSVFDPLNIMNPGKAF